MNENGHFVLHEMNKGFEWISNHYVCLKTPSEFEFEMIKLKWWKNVEKRFSRVEVLVQKSRLENNYFRSFSETILAHGIGYGMIMM